MDDKQRLKQPWLVKAGLLRKDEKQLFLDMVTAGIVPTQAAKFLGRTYATIAKTEIDDKNFARALDEAKGGGLAQQCEEVLLCLAKGKAKTVKTKWLPVFIDGEMQLDDKGEPIMRLASREETRMPPDRAAAKIYLEANRAAKYGEHQSTPAKMGDETDPAALWAQLGDKYGIQPPAAPPTPSDDESEPEAQDSV